MRLLLSTALLGLLWSCHSTSCPEWHSQHIGSDSAAFRSDAFTFMTGSSPSQMELVISSTQQRTAMYINLLTFSASPLREDPSRTSAQVMFLGEEPWVIQPYILEGGQRLLVPGDVADILICRLREGDSFLLKIGRFEIQVTPFTIKKMFAKNVVDRS